MNKSTQKRLGGCMLMLPGVSHHWLSFIDVWGGRDEDVRGFMMGWWGEKEKHSKEQTWKKNNEEFGLLQFDGIFPFPGRKKLNMIQSSAAEKKQRNPSRWQRRSDIYRQAEELHGTLFIRSFRNGSGRYRLRRRLEMMKNRWRTRKTIWDVKLKVSQPAVCFFLLFFLFSVIKLIIYSSSVLKHKCDASIIIIQ